MIGSTAIATDSPVGRTRYYAVNIGDLPGGSVCSFPRAINEAGEVAGQSCSGPNIAEALIWTREEGMRALGWLPGDRPGSDANDINNLGNACGRSQGEAFFWSEETGLVGLGHLGGTDNPGSAALGMNDLNDVVGRADAPVGRVAFLWTPDDGMIALGKWGDPLFPLGARAINNAGFVVGQMQSPRALFEAFIWDAKTGLCDLGTLPDGRIALDAVDINEAGHVCGSLGGEAFLWTPQTGLRPLGVIPGQSAWTAARGLNDVGQVVGDAEIWPFTPYAWIWDEQHGIRLLDDLLAAGVTGSRRVTKAVGINNAGQIACYPFQDTAEAIVLYPFIVGDLNCDGLVDFDDIAPLLTMHLSPDQFADWFPECAELGPWAADCNQDGDVTFRDVAELLAYLRQN